MGSHRSAREPIQTANDGVMALGADVGSHPHQLVDVAEATGKDVLGDDPHPVGGGEQRHEEGLVVSGQARIRQRRHVDGAETARGHSPHPVSHGGDTHPHLPQLLHEHVHVVSPSAGQGDLASGRPKCGQERRRLDSVGHHAVFDRGQALDALDSDRRAPRPQHVCPHTVEESGQVGDLGLAGGVVDDRGPLGQDRGHERVLRGTHAGELEQDPGAVEPVGRCLDVPVRRLESGTQLFEPAQVHVDGSWPEVVAAGEGHPRPAESGQQRAEHHDGGPHPLDQLVGGLGHDAGGMVDGELVGITTGHRHAHRRQQIAHVFDIGDGRHVAQDVRALGQAGGGHQLEHRVLGPADGHDARQRSTGPHHDAIGRPGAVHAAQYAPPGQPGEVDRIKEPLSCPRS